MLKTSLRHYRAYVPRKGGSDGSCLNGGTSSATHSGCGYYRHGMAGPDLLARQFSSLETGAPGTDARLRKNGGLAEHVKSPASVRAAARDAFGQALARQRRRTGRSVAQ